MNLQTLFDLKKQLDRLAIAGTSLLENDFRLQKSLEAIAPLAASSPVFAKISESLKNLLEAPQEKRNSIFLDVLALVNAVVYTQGSFGCAGELTEQKAEPGRCLELSYTKLKEILDPITSKGSGRFAPIQEIWNHHPEYFADYRVIYRLIDALDENYAELGTLYVKILLHQLKEGNFSPKLLEDNFDPEGKRSMIRRVQLLAYATEEQEWLLEQLPKAKKGVKEAILLALGKDKANLPILLDLANTEKGKNYQAVLRALAHIDTYETKQLWEKEFEKDPLAAIQLLAGSTTSLAIELASQFLLEIMKNLAANPQNKEAINAFPHCLEAMAGKWNADSVNVWSQAAQYAKHIYNNPSNCGATTTMLAAALAKSLVVNPCNEAKATAQCLAEQYPSFLCLGFLADALTLSSEALYDKYAGKIVHKSLLRWETKDKRTARLQITAAISWIYHSELHKSDGIYYSYHDYLTNIIFDKFQPINKLDLRWFTLLTAPDVGRPDSIDSYFSDLPQIGSMYYSLEQIMAWLIDSKDQARCKIIGDFLYQSAKKEKNVWIKADYFKYLKRCGWSDSDLEFLQ